MNHRPDFLCRVIPPTRTSEKAGHREYFPHAQTTGVGNPRTMGEGIWYALLYEMQQDTTCL